MLVVERLRFLGKLVAEGLGGRLLGDDVVHRVLHLNVGPRVEPSRFYLLDAEDGDLVSLAELGGWLADGSVVPADLGVVSGVGRKDAGRSL